MKRSLQLALLLATAFLGQPAFAQGTAPARAARAQAITAGEPWAYSITVDGYLVDSEQGYASPVFTADHNWLHLEARYNYENFRTGSLWVGYNFSAGKNLVFTITPILGGVFGRTNGIAPGCEASLSYKKAELSVSNEYVFDTEHSSASFYYSWPELTYQVRDWFKVGAVAQHTKTLHTQGEIDGGFLVGFSRHVGASEKKLEFNTYVFPPGAGSTVVLEAAYEF